MKTDLTYRKNNRVKIGIAIAGIFLGSAAFAQSTQAVVDNIVQEETNNSQLQQMAHELFDGVGPRLVGTPQMDKAGDWAVARYKSWDISAKKEKLGRLARLGTRH